MPLTDTAIKALKPKTARYTISDARGLVLEVFPAGGMLWHYRYRLNGKQERVTLGRYPALSLKLARGERDKRETMVALGESPAEQKRLAKVAAADTTTVAEFGERFFKEVVAKDRQDMTSPRRYFDKSIVPAIGSKPVRDVTTEDVRAIIWRKKDEGFDAAAGELRGVLKRFFDYALTAGLATANPVLALPMRHVHKAKSRERALSPEEVRVFLRAAFESNIRRQFKIGLHLILLTMVRKSELLLARWEHVDFDQAEWHIPAEHSKTGKPHIVFLSRQSIALFKELHMLAGGSALVMPGRGSLTKPTWWRRR
jgi:integrase